MKSVNPVAFDLDLQCLLKSVFPVASDLVLRLLVRLSIGI